jgi:lysophospholipase L1-like esterase
VSPRKVLATTKKIIRKIKRDNKETKIVLIAVKPSLSRWSLKDKYLKLNKKFQRFSHRKSQVSFADVWAPMLENKALKEDLFISDGLHMNQKGYQLWEQVIGPLILK